MKEVQKSKAESMKEIFEECRIKGITVEDLLWFFLLAIDSKTEVADGKSINQRVTDILRKLGMPAHIKGYEYVRYAIIYVLENPDAIDGVTKVLYPAVAKKLGTTGSEVEKRIRYAIEVACKRGGTEMFYKVFGYSISPEKRRPTNSEFIAAVVDYININ